MNTTNPSLAQILTRRLVWIAGIVILLNALAVFTYYGLDREALESEVIERQMVILEAGLSGAPPSIDERARGLFKAHPGHYAFAVVDRQGRILDAENAGLIPVQATETGAFAQDWVTRVRSPSGQTLVAAHKIDDHPDQLRLIFLMKGDPGRLMLHALAAEFSEHIWLPILPVALILIAANAFMIRRGLRPVAWAAQWARRIRPGLPAPAMPAGLLPAEISDLVDATQRSLERVNAALAAEKRHAAEAAHGLRTPVAVLMARLDTLPPGETTEQLRADLTALSRTVAQVLASARADVLEVHDDVHTDLAGVADSVTAALAPLAYEKGLELALRVEQAPVMASADPDGVELALSNLVENAILHAGRGMVDISVGPGPVIRVQDQGPGVPPGGGRKLFEPFWRGDGAPAGGTGLGLAIVERLQRAQGGEVAVRSRAGGGAEFILTYRPVHR